MRESERQPQLRIEHDAEEPPPTRTLAAVRQQRVVGQHGADAGKQGIVRVTQLLHPGPRRRARDGERCAFSMRLRGWRDRAVECRRDLERDQRRVMADGMCKGVVELSRLRRARADQHFDAGFAQHRQPLARYQRIGIGA